MALKGLNTGDQQIDRLVRPIVDAFNRFERAMQSAKFLTLATVSDLVEERILTPGRHLVGTDSGRGAAYTLDWRHDPRYLDLVDEFFGAVTTTGNIGEQGWGTTNSAAPTITYQAGVTDHPGILRMQTGAISGNNVRLHLTDTATNTAIAANQVERFTWIVRIPTVSSVVVRVGLGQDVSSATFGTDGVWFELDTAVSGNWRCVTRASSTSTAVTTAVPVTANNWYVLEAVRSVASTVVIWEFSINGTSTIKTTTNAPTASVNFGTLVQTATAAARQLDVDYARLRTSQLGVRYT